MNVFCFFFLGRGGVGAFNERTKFTLRILSFLDDYLFSLKYNSRFIQIISLFPNINRYLHAYKATLADRGETNSPSSPLHDHLNTWENKIKGPRIRKTVTTNKLE